MVQSRAFRWDLMYGLALAVILTVAVAFAWIQGDGGNRAATSPAIPAAHSAEKCD